MLFENDDQRRLNVAHLEKIKRILARLLDEATNITHMALPGFGLHRLKGNLKDFWAVSVSGNWRIIFRFENSNAYDVDLVDYHQEKPMPMKNPPHPGLSVRYDRLEPLGISVTQGPKILGVIRQALNNLVNGKAAISPEMAIRLHKAFGGGAETWLRLQAAYDLAQAEKRANKIKVRRVA